MATNKMNDGVGKKIVEALKMQSSEDADVLSDNDEMHVHDDSLTLDTTVPEFDSGLNSDNINNEQNDFSNPQDAASIPSELQIKIQTQLQEQAKQAQFQSAINSSVNPAFVDNAFQQSLVQHLGQSAFGVIQDDFNYPANIAVLIQLIGKLPAGVSKQTGALIIRQTMEALGISMQSVMQEAKQVQETLKNNTRECQTTIAEYRKQIGILETKSQQYQKQYAVMNDVINLFLQTSGK